MFRIDRKNVETNSAAVATRRRMRGWSVAGGLALAAVGGVHAVSAASFSPDAMADAMTKSTVYEQPAAILRFRIDHPPECKRGTEESPTDFQCELTLGDLKNGNEDASLIVRIYDRVVDFDQADANLRNSSPLPGQKHFSMAANVKGEAPGGGPSDKDVAPGACHQNRGDPNGIALCFFLLDPHVALIAATFSARPRVDLGNDAHASDDMVRAEQLGFVGVAWVNATLSSVRSAATPTDTNPGETGKAVSAVPSAPNEARVYGSAPDGNWTEPLEGSVLWSTLTDASGGKILVGRAAIDTADLTAIVEISRNADPTVPATHIVKMTIHAKEGLVVALPTVFARQGDAPQGTKLRGTSVRVIDNVFMFGLKPDPTDRAANTDLVARADWLDLPIQFANGRRQLIALELDSIARQALNKEFDETAKR